MRRLLTVLAATLAVFSVGASLWAGAMTSSTSHRRTGVFSQLTPDHL